MNHQTFFGDGTLWKIIGGHGFKLFERDGILYAQDFEVQGNHAFWCGKPYASRNDVERAHFQKCWKERESAPRVKRIREAGKGYIGGHQTAMMQGWPTHRPAPRPESVLWWDDSEVGTSCGYYPAMVSLVMI